MALDQPFDEVVEKGTKLIMAGHSLHQKFTCGRCLSRVTVERPNFFFQKGKCEACDYETDLVARGCGFALMVRVNGH